MIRFYEYINRTQIKPAPRPLKIDGKDIFTTDEAIYNANGYYRLEAEEYPQDEKQYTPYYEMGDNVILQKWEEIIISDESN